MKREDEILDFIKNFDKPQVIETFTEGCCFWFAHILYHRFGVKESDIQDGWIVYNPVDNHFAYWDRLTMGIYDVTGRLANAVDVIDKTWYLWETYKTRDNLETERIIKYCINKLN